MTRKDYVKLARVVREVAEEYASHGHWHAVNSFKMKLAEVLAADSPRFDRERFYRACEPEKEEKL